MPQRSRHSTKTEKTPSIAGPPEPPLTVQEPPAQVALDSLRNFRLATTFPSQPVSVTVGHRDTSVVDAVLKRFPPPPGPNDRDPDTHSTQMGNSESLDSSRTFESNQPPKSCRPTEQPNLQTLRPARANSAAVSSDTPPTPGLVTDHRNTHTLPWNTTHFVFLQGRQLLWVTAEILYFSPYFGAFGKTPSPFSRCGNENDFSDNHTLKSRVFFFFPPNLSVGSHLAPTEPRQQTETAEPRAKAREENPPKPPSVGPAEPAGAQPEPNNLYVWPHHSDSRGA